MGGGKDSKVKGKSGPLKMEAELNLAYVFLTVGSRICLKIKCDFDSH